MIELGNCYSVPQSEVIPQQNFDLIQPRSDSQTHLSFVTVSEILNVSASVSLSGKRIE